MSHELTLTFAAAFHAAKTDHDGESTIVLKVPLSALNTVLELAKWNGRLLRVTVATEPRD